MRLHEDKEQFTVVVEAVSELNGIPTFYVEKDYWVTQCLKNVAADEEMRKHTIFKGGTALSKVHKAIRRFSEDIDFAVTDEVSNRTQTQCKKFLKSIIDRARAHPEIENLQKTDEDVSRNREFKRYCKYEALFPFPTDDYSRSKEEIIIEVNSFGVPKPNAPEQVISLVGEYCQAEQTEIYETYELHPFEMHVISKERAFLDKVLAMQNAFFRYRKKIKDNETLSESEPAAEIDLEARNKEERDMFISRLRHLYDLKVLLDDAEVRALLETLEENLEPVIASEDGKCTIEELKSSDLYQKPREILSEFSEDWQRLQPMLFKAEPLPSLEDVCGVLSTIHNHLPG